MWLTEEVEKQLHKNHLEICKALNLDKSSAYEAWKTLLQLTDLHILEGEPVHWLGCTIYIACKSSFTPTVSKPNVIVQGNLVSLTRLLRIINLSLIDFFVKMRKCSHYLNLPDDFQEHMDKLEKNFNVSMILYRKFQPIFNDVFCMESVDSPKVSKAKKLKTHPPSCWRIMDFTWTLFICVKADVNNITDDLVHSYHLLLACVDFVYANLYLAGRKEMLRSDICPTVVEQSNISSLADLPCIIDYLCSQHDGIAVDVKCIKEYCLRKYVKKMFDMKSIRGNDELLCDVMDISKFDANMTSLGNSYEKYTLSSGGVDERVFLGHSSNMCNIGNFGAYGGGNTQEIGEQLEARRKQNAEQNKANPPLTPLSGRRYLRHPENSLPLVGVNNSSINIHSTLMSRDPGPTEVTVKVIKSCSKTPIVESTVDDLSEILHKKLTESITSTPGSLKEVRNVTDLSAKLFYKFLDSILPKEVKKPTFDPNVMLNNVELIKALFACAAEVVLFTSKITKKFPWIVDTLSIPPYYCYKVIEVVVTNENLLTRESVKHLNSIEESILESLAWTPKSPLWKALVESGLPVPSCEEVVQDGAIEITEVNSSKISGDRLMELAGNSSILTNSPGAPLAEKFMSPVKKRPLVDVERTAAPSKIILVSRSDGTVAPENADKTQEDGSAHSEDVNPTKNIKENKKPKRTGSTSLFFRKFYYLAVVRMLDMCDQLGLGDIELRKKIWTCFELTIVHHIGLMWNRHLDQILMCSIYIICKIVEKETSFMGMMKCYRNQPQAQSHVYRQVLIKPDKSFEDVKNELNKQPTVVEERGDIIRFYNEVFIHKVEKPLRRFKTTSDSNRVVLSPILVGKSTPVSGPRRVSDRHPLYLRDFPPRSPNAAAQLQYYFSRSPAKDLHAINTMVCKTDLKKLKCLNDDTTELKDHSNSMSQKLKDMYADRISMNKQEVGKLK